MPSSTSNFVKFQSAIWYECGYSYLFGNLDGTLGVSVGIFHILADQIPHSRCPGIEIKIRFDLFRRWRKLSILPQLRTTLISNRVAAAVSQ